MGRLEPEGRDYDFDTDAERDRELEEQLLWDKHKQPTTDDPDGS